MALQLNEVEVRVLGVMIEKSLTTPGSYPLTLNAILLGANQKQNRDPVVEFTEAQIAQATHALQRRQLVKQAPPVAGARANRFEHNVVERLKWDRRQQAVLAELMIRGSQTAGELRGRGSRMTPIPDLLAVHEILHTLSTCDPPYLRELEREPGRSAIRFEHLLSSDIGDNVGTVVGLGPAVAVETPAKVEETIAAVEHPAKGAETIDVAGLADRLAALEARVAELEKPSTPQADPPRW